jgi:hypothetical protein
MSLMIASERAGRMRARAGRVESWEVVLVALTCAGFAAVCVVTSGFPLGVHADEGRKVVLVATGANDFFHPLLMLTLTRGYAGCWGLRMRMGF